MRGVDPFRNVCPNCSGRSVRLKKLPGLDSNPPAGFAMFAAPFDLLHEIGIVVAAGDVVFAGHQSFAQWRNENIGRNRTYPKTEQLVLPPIEVMIVCPWHAHRDERCRRAPPKWLQVGPGVVTLLAVTFRVR